MKRRFAKWLSALLAIAMLIPSFALAEIPGGGI